MSKNGGWVKIHRKILKWEWYDEPNVWRIFTHCLLKANYKDKEWRGISIKRGSFITSYANLSKETKLSVQQTRTAIAKLESTGELTIKTSNRNTMVIINNYSEHQSINEPGTSQSTINQRSINKQSTTTKKDKKEKKEKNIIINSKYSHELEDILNKWNFEMGTKMKSTRAIKGNYEIWREEYELEDIFRAIEAIQSHSFWSDKMKLATLFRTKNSNGDCDYIGDLLASRVTSQPNINNLKVTQI